MHQCACMHVFVTGTKRVAHTRGSRRLPASPSSSDSQSGGADFPTFGFRQSVLVCLFFFLTHLNTSAGSKLQKKKVKKQTNTTEIIHDVIVIYLSIHPSMGGHLLGCPHWQTAPDANLNSF